MAFVNRSDAGHGLAEALSGYRRSCPVVLALPRGGALATSMKKGFQIADALRYEFVAE